MSEFVVLYHVGCNDGAAAAWCARERLGDRAIYKAHQYTWKLPDVIDGKHLILVDLSLPVDVIEELVNTKRVLSVMVIDHHKSAMPIVDKYPKLRRLEDYERLSANNPGFVGQFIAMNRSGAVLSWLFFQNTFNDLIANHYELNAAMPSILHYIEDYDLWLHKLDGTQYVNRWLIDGGLSIDRVGESMDEDGSLRPEVLTSGKAFHDYNMRIAKSVCKNYVQEYEYAGQKFALINSPHHLRNDVGDVLVEKYLFVACYTQRDEVTVFSLRALKGKFDVSKVAEQFGGGGHAESAAFSIPNQMRNPFDKPTLMRRLYRAWRVLIGKE